MRGRRRLSGDLDRRRQRHADGLEHGASATGSGGAKAKPSAGLIDVGLNELIEIANDIGPFIATPIGGETVDEFLAQQQSKEGTEHMAANRIIALVKDRARIDEGFRGSENILHDPSLAIAERDNQRRDLHIGTDDIDAVEFGGRGDTLGVDGEVAVAFGLEEAAEAFVADQRFVALTQRLFQSGKGGFASGGIVVRICTRNNLAPYVEPDT
jgi:hypothetical protein